jgi:crotonobetainyl-CoA:carnitine CoA-transferase CaiB-like acyl-CoA transferase
MTATDAISDEHLRAREFLGPATDGARSFLVPVRPWRAPGLPAPASHVAAPGEDDAWLPRGDDAPPATLPRLSGVRVLELTRAWAGPFVGRFLGALGADVVKLEAGRSPDGWRARLRWRSAGVELPPGQDPEAYTWDAAALFNGLNRNKRQISLDLTRPGARLVFLGLVARTDLLVVNMTARVLDDFALGYDALAKVNPRLVLLQMPALGASGPSRAMPGYGMLIEGMGGFAARYGARDEAARATATYYPDAVAGIHATVAALAALAARERSGRGCEVDLSQQETLWLQLAEGIALASLEGREPDRLGDAEPGCSPSGIYPCADGWLALVASSDAEVSRLAALAGDALADLARLPRERRLAERDRVDAPLAAWTSRAKAADLEQELRRAGLRARAVFDFRRASLPPDLARLDPYEELVHPVTGRRTYLRVPLRIDGAPLASRRPAPTFDQHTDEVLAEWAQAGAADLEWLRRERVIGGRPGAGAASE